jgi:hypothetical protein
MYYLSSLLSFLPYRNSGSYVTYTSLMQEEVEEEGPNNFGTASSPLAVVSYNNYKQDTSDIIFNKPLGFSPQMNCTLWSSGQSSWLQI